MLDLKQILWIISAICCGNLVAIWLHCQVWEVRQRRLRGLRAVGYVSLAIVIFVLAVWWREAETQSFFVTLGME